MEKVDLPKIKRRLWSFESTFQKHADLCEYCYALVIWSLGSPKPSICRRCHKAITNDIQSKKKKTADQA